MVLVAKREDNERDEQAPAELIDADDAVDRQIRSAVCLSIGGAKAAS